MKVEKRTSILFIILLVVALAMSVVLVQQTQELRKGAYFADTRMLLQPTEINTRVGDEFGVQVWVDTPEGVKVDGAQSDLCYDSSIVSPEVGTDIYESVIPNSSAGMSQVPLALVIGETEKCIRFAITSNRAADSLKSGMVNVGKIMFKAVAVGSGQLTLKLDKSTVTGDNPESGDKYMKVVTVAGASVNVLASGAPLPTTSPGTSVTPTPSAEDMWINYKVAFSGVKADRGCANNWQTKLTVLSGQTRKEYTNLPLVKTNSTNAKGEVIYEGSMQLAGFRQSSNVAVFLKGPKHLQVKYGKSGQSELYNKAGGEISLTNNKDTSPVLQLAAYPMLAGDVNGDGVIDGIDFASVKAKATKFEEVSTGGYLAEDLDGSCQVNNNDIILLVRSLNEKQDQVY